MDLREKQSDNTKKVVQIYTTRSEENKLLGDVIKAKKSATDRRRRMKNVLVIESKENPSTEVVDMEELEEYEDIDSDVVAVITNKKKQMLAD